MNKKIIMMAVLCAIGTAATAQLEKGKVMIGGNVSYYKDISRNGLEPEMSSNSISPTAGLFLKDNLAIGTSIRYVRSFSGDLGNFERQTNYALIPFVRYYLNITTDFKFFTEFMVIAGMGRSKGLRSYDNQRFKRKTQEFGAAIAPGLAFLPAKRWSVDLRFNLLDYTNSRVKNTSPYAERTRYVKSDNFNFGLNTSNPSVGVHYHL